MASGKPVLVLCAQHNKDLGHIKSMFSDKTGMLADKRVEFQCANVHAANFSSERLLLMVDRFS